MLKRDEPDWCALTAKQQQVCNLVIEGFSNKEIGDSLGISPRTVEEHRKVVFKKLKVRNAVQLVRKVFGVPE